MREIKFRAWKGTQMLTFEEMKDGDCDAWPTLYFALTSDEYIPMQFTGLHDKNGVEIYEGDICKTYRYKTDENGSQRLSEGNKEYHNVVVEYVGKTPFVGYVIHDWYEVIGNIYENPELLA